MTDDEKWRHIKECILLLMEQNERISKAARSIGLIPESVFLDAFNLSNDKFIDSLSMLVDDTGEYISWFILENNYGRGDLTAGIKDNMQMIKTVDDLRWLIELGTSKDESNAKNT